MASPLGTAISVGAGRGRADTSPLIVTRTPLRVSFAGGGTDLPAFYERDYGAVFSTAITSYIYVTVKRHSPLFNERIRLNYSKSEEVDELDEVENDIARECMRLLGIEPPIYISTVGDHPASAGLGGSSAFAVGLLHALHAYRGERVTAGQLAEEASTVEMEILGQPIGKQDQYAVAFGGINFFRFEPGGGVTVEPQRIVNGAAAELFGHLLMFWTGHQPDSADVLTEQRANTDRKRESLVRMRGHAEELRALVADGRLEPVELGRILDESWQLKRDLASRISNDRIDALYERALETGAEGGKICGAGGGGCLLFVVRPERQEAVRAALAELTEVPIGYDVHGSRLLLPAGV
jgi:D-glycero-alpha-D-manno-heptose-7-phosphate kinase